MPNQFNSPEGDLENYFVTESWLIDQWVGDTLWTWGFNDNGQLGVNDAGTNTRCTPVTSSAGGANWKQVAGGEYYTAAIKTDGTLWTWGQNNLGQLGINDTNPRCTPITTFAGGTNWKQVACGYSAAAIKTDGTLWTWGDNSYGNLGVNDTNRRCTPVTTFVGGTNWKQVSAGSFNTSAIKTDGTLWIWGRNEHGQLGINEAGGTTHRTTPVTTFAGGTNWKQVACGQYYTAAIKTDGTLWTWGRNSYGQLGNNNTNPRCTPVTTFAGGTNWKQVFRGGVHIAAIKTDGTLWTWGRNAFGQLGVNDTIDRSTPVTTFVGGTNWKQVSGGYRYTAAIKTDGTLWTWGRGTEGQLGVNDANGRTTPVQTFAGGTNWKQVAGGIGHTLAVTSGTDPTYFIS
jgi:alpha-tubulin suppressor-like RCC1 family protein